MKYLFIKIKVQDGYREHIHKVLHTTTCTNIEFAIIWYIAHYWGYGTLDKNYLPCINIHTKRNKWWFDNEITCEVISYSELTEEEYLLLSKYI